MLEAIFFMLGAIFSLALLMAILSMIGSGPRLVTENNGAAATASRPNGRSQTNSANSSRKASSVETDRLALGVATAAERESYRIQSALERAQGTLSRIASSREPAAAKIAAQTLRRISQADARPADRLSFAKSRLELLSLRPEPAARQAARMTLSMLG